jgi:catechol 2,3-dioxygenase-like lactoylglutathione lyase family enzyme
MQSHLAHLEVKIDGANVSFYKDLLTFLGWNTLYEAEGWIGLGGTNGASLWFTAGANAAQNDYDGRGVNHIGLGAESISDVDALVGYLKDKGIPLLFETPRHRPEFAGGESETYYQVMFESPDKVLFEFVYTGPK